MQANLPLRPQIAPAPRDLDPALLAHCRNYRDAIRVGISRSPYLGTQEDLADALSMAPGTLSQILNSSGKRKRYLDPDRFREIEQILGNRCISQFFELESKGFLVKDREMTVEEKARAYDAQRLA